MTSLITTVIGNTLHMDRTLPLSTLVEVLPNTVSFRSNWLCSLRLSNSVWSCSFLLSLLGWHWLTILYRLQGYSSIIQHLHIVLCVHHPKSSLPPSPFIRTLPSSTAPTPFLSSNHHAVDPALSLLVLRNPFTCVTQPPPLPCALWQLSVCSNCPWVCFCFVCSFICYSFFPKTESCFFNHSINSFYLCFCFTMPSRVPAMSIEPKTMTFCL